MHNPGVMVLVRFLRTLKKMQPINHTPLYMAAKQGRVTKYIKFCLERKLVKVERVEEHGMRRPSKFYVLTESGEALLEVFKEWPI